MGIHAATGVEFDRKLARRGMGVVLDTERHGRKDDRAGRADGLAWWEEGFGEIVAAKMTQKAQVLLIETRFVSLPRRNVAQTLWRPLPVAIARSNFSCLGATPALQKARRGTMFFSSSISL